MTISSRNPNLRGFPRSAVARPLSCPDVRSSQIESVSLVSRSQIERAGEADISWRSRLTNFVNRVIQEGIRHNGGNWHKVCSHQPCQGMTALHEAS